jgi:hypothetical protein
VNDGRNDGEMGAVMQVAKVGFLLATDDDCKKAGISAERGPNGKVRGADCDHSRSDRTVAPPTPNCARAVGLQCGRALASGGKTNSHQRWSSVGSMAGCMPGL